jgi:hypothetical protein
MTSPRAGMPGPYKIHGANYRKHAINGGIP